MGMSGEELNGLIMRWAKKNGFVVLGFAGFGGYETYSNYNAVQMDLAIRREYVDELIKMIHEDKAIENIQQKNRQQDRRLEEIELILTEY